MTTTTLLPKDHANPWRALTHPLVPGLPIAVLMAYVAANALLGGSAFMVFSQLTIVMILIMAVLLSLVIDTESSATILLYTLTASGYTLVQALRITEVATAEKLDSTQIVVDWSQAYIPALLVIAATTAGLVWLTKVVGYSIKKICSA